MRRREEVAEACAAAAATAVTAKPASVSSSASQRKVVVAPVPSTSAWSVLPPSAGGGAASAPAVSLFDMGGVSDGSFYCDYCNVFCNSELQLDAHCASAKHKLSISSDREHQWNYRPPPLTVAGGQYSLCPRLALFYALIVTLLSSFVLH